MSPIPVLHHPSARERVVDFVRPTPWSQLSTLHRARRGFGVLMFLSSLAMAAAAATASSDWNITQDEVEKRFG